MREDKLRNAAKQAILSKKVTESDMAKETGCSEDQIYMYLQNGTSIPLTKKVLLAEFLQVDIQTGTTT